LRRDISKLDTSKKEKRAAPRAAIRFPGILLASPAVTTTASALENEVVLLLQAHRAGDAAASRRLFELLYADLRALARRRLALERRDHTLAPTSLVHEVFLRLDRAALDCEDRRDYLALAAGVMRRILIDSARRRCQREDLPARARESESALHPLLERRVLALECAMERLERVDPQLARVVELRFFLGLEVDAVARTLGISTASVQRDWRSARAFLLRAIETEDQDGR
jgi:RNA polymerase sigma-70 factor, ECF subfamily